MWAMAWPTFMTQSMAFAYAIIVDCNPNPVVPKPLAILGVVLFILGIPATVSTHCVKTEAIAWDGAIGFWASMRSTALDLISGWPLHDMRLKSSWAP